MPIVSDTSVLVPRSRSRSSLSSLAAYMTQRYFPILLLLLLATVHVNAQSGCTDPMATNYDPTAVVNDGSCVYPVTSLSLSPVTDLTTPLLDENSGLLYLDGQLWLHVDDLDTNLYRIDTTNSTVLESLPVRNAWNYDWEDISSDSQYVYVGDVGNNVGSRTNLSILRFDKAQLSSGAGYVQVDTIRFSYADQTDFTPALDNTRFDCEAFVVVDDTLHLFSKDWVTKRTRRYKLPAQPGTYSIAPVDSLEANGLITSAARSADGAIVLLGYDNVIPAPCFLWLLFDYPGTDFFAGNKRRFSLGSAVTAGQVEGICFTDNRSGFVSNERFQQIVNVPPRLKRFDISAYITAPITAIDDGGLRQLRLLATPNGYVLEHAGIQGEFSLVNLSGRKCREERLGQGSTRIERDRLSSGAYLLTVRSANGSSRTFRIVF